MKTRQKLQTEGGRRRMVEGRFFPQGTGQPTQGSGQGQFTVTRSGVGTFLITFAEKYARLSSYECAIQHTTAVDLKGQFGDFTAATATTPATIVFRLVAVAAATDMAANANSSVAVKFIFAEGASDPG